MGQSPFLACTIGGYRILPRLIFQHMEHLELLAVRAHSEIERAASAVGVVVLEAPSRATATRESDPA